MDHISLSDLPGMFQNSQVLLHVPGRARFHGVEAQTGTRGLYGDWGAIPGPEYAL